MRRASKIDSNQPTIVAGLRKAGATVAMTHMIGKGFPDAVVGYRGVNYLLEIKDDGKPPSARKLTSDEVEWHTAWRGKVVVVENLEQALIAIGAV